MDTKPNNPLSKHFRKPVMHIRLPSDGKFWAENSLDLPVTGEIPVYPMTAGDEITLKTPDALLNGAGVVSVIQSCCPSIVDAWKMPSIDVDTVLIAIRVASYGNAMGISTKCPGCGENHEYDIDLSGLISKVKSPDYSRPIEFEDLKIYTKPQIYFSVTANNLVQYEEQRILQTINSTSEDEDVRNAKLAASMKKLLGLANELLVNSTDYIELSDGTQVSNRDHIKEFYANADGRVTKLLEARLSELAQEGALPLTKLSCTGCKNEYETPLEFDYSTFFA